MPGVTVLRKVAQHQIVARLTLQHLGQRVAADSGLHGILNVRNVDLIACGLLAVHGYVQVGLAKDWNTSQLFDPLDPAHDADDLICFCLEDLQVIAIDFGGQFTFDAADRFFHVVFNRLGKAPNDARDFFQFAIHGCDHFFLVPVKHRTPVFLRLQADVVFGVKKLVVSVPSSGRPV